MDESRLSVFAKGSTVALIHACFSALWYSGYGRRQAAELSGYPNRLATTHFVPLMPPFANAHSTDAS